MPLHFQVYHPRIECRSYNNVSQLDLDWITSIAMLLYKNAPHISGGVPISRKKNAHKVQPTHFYIVASTERDDARFDN